MTKLYLAVLICFLAAFAGLAAGLLLRRKGPHGGCSLHPKGGKDCQCDSTGDSIKKSKISPS